MLIRWEDMGAELDGVGTGAMPPAPAEGVALPDMGLLDGRNELDPTGELAGWIELEGVPITVLDNPPGAVLAGPCTGPPTGPGGGFGGAFPGGAGGAPACGFGGGFAGALAGGAGGAVGAGFAGP